MSDVTARGGCVCGQVSYEVRGPLRPVMACHCNECRKLSGHYVAATACADADLTLVEASGLKWFASSGTAKRGFCGECGSNLFFKDTLRDSTSIHAGTIDGATGLQTSDHIYCSEKGDYYEIADGAPHHGCHVDEV